jgi:hypothetical protein
MCGFTNECHFQKLYIQNHYIVFSELSAQDAAFLNLTKRSSPDARKDLSA